MVLVPGVKHRTGLGGGDSFNPIVHGVEHRTWQASKCLMSSRMLYAALSIDPAPHPLLANHDTALVTTSLARIRT